MENLKIILFTQIPKLRNIEYNSDEILSLGLTFTLEAPYISIGNNGIVSNLDTNAVVLMVYDFLDISENQTIPDILNKEDVTIIKHNNMHPSILDATANNGITGMHEPYDNRNKPYKDLIDLLIGINNDNNAQNKALIDKFISNIAPSKDLDLQKKLQLLHEIYEGKDYSEISSYKSLEEFIGKLIHFKSIVPDDYKNDDKAHRDALIELRDALLANV